LSGEDAQIIVILGSPADRSWGERISGALEGFGLSSETHVASAHKTPEWLLDMLKIWEGRTPHVYITVAGRSNALSGFVDAQVTAPVIACPPPSEAFAGLDILSSLRMPRGVAPVVVLEPENAALAAAKMLGLLVPEIQTRVAESQAAERERVLSRES
jgi:5-(carboxyamino)imidazole ribonucleotide mutase